MAFVFKPNQAKDKNNPQGNQAPGQGQTLSSGQGSVITGQNPQGGASPGQQKASSSGRFSNIQSFVKANDPNQLAGQVTGKIGEEKNKAAGQLSEAKSQVDKSTQATGEAVAAAKAKLQGAQTGLQGAYAAQGGPVDENAFNQNLEGFKQGIGLQYQGAEDLGNQANLRTQAQNLQSIGAATQNASGRNALLQRFFGNPQYAAGQRTLDTVLLGSQRPQLQKAAAQANTFGGELDTARRAALANIQQARSGVTGTNEEARKAVEGQIGTAKGAIQERAAQAQSIRDLLRKQDNELQFQADASQPSITGDARSDAALRQAMQGGFINQAQVDAFKNLQGRIGNVGYNTRDVLGRTLLEGEETGDQLAARAASQQQASRVGALQGLIGQQGAYNPYQYNDKAAEQMVTDREGALVNALRNTDYDFSGDYSNNTDLVASMARLGLVAPGAAMSLGALGAGQKASDTMWGATDKAGLTNNALGNTLKQGDLLRYSSKNQLAQNLGAMSDEQLNKIGGMKQFGDVSSQAVTTIADRNKQVAQAAQNALGGIGGALGGIAKKFCFAPDTLVAMEDGSFKQIQDVKLGEAMLNGGLVYSISSHLVDESQVFSYNGIIVTADHAVEENGRWLRVKDSKKAIPAPGATSIVYSLSNAGHRIVTTSAIFADYDEVDNPEGLNDHQCLMILNRSK